MLRTFSVERTAQAAGILLRLAENQRMPFIGLLKLLYMADRESIQETGFPITGDDPFAMERGPVLSITYDLIKGSSPNPHVQDLVPIWKQWIRTVADHDVELAADPGHRKLSRYERQKLQEVFERYADRDRWTLIQDLHRSLQEWQECYRHDGSAVPIPVEAVLRAVGREADIEAILADSQEHLASLARSKA